jgi:ATP-binding cassette, subfamily B, bacterial HlyB/CyaB
MSRINASQESVADIHLRQPDPDSGNEHLGHNQTGHFDTGLGALALAFSLLGSRLDIERVAREYLAERVPASAEDLVRIARAEGFKARVSHSSVARIDQLPVPAVARRRDGRFFLLGRRVAGGVLVGIAGGPPVEWSLEQLQREWTGEIVLFAARASNDIRSQLFGLGWFWPVIKRFRRIFAEVLVLSALLQILALATPLFTQVVIDKVMVHNSLTTLDVLALGLAAVVVTEALLGFLRTYTFSHTTSRMDAILGAQLFGHLLALPIAWFESRATGQTVARVRELENIRNFLTSSTLTLVLDTAFGLIFLSVMAWYSLTLTFVVLASIPAYVAISLLVTPGLKARVDEKFRTGAATQSMPASRR